MHLQIKHKLIILVAVAVLALISVGTFSFVLASKLDSTLRTAIENHAQLVEAVDEARGAQVSFKTQVQEWKNILLRGKDTEAYNKHLTGFNDQEQKVKERLEHVRAVADKLGIAERLKIAGVISTFEKLGPAYRDALTHYERNSADPASTVDKLVHGVDRTPTKAIDDLVAEMQKVAGELNSRERASADEVFSSVRIGLVAFSLAAVAVLGVLATLFVRSITGPLEKLETTMTHIAGSGDLTQRAEITHRDEIGRMAGAFNTMMDQLQKLIGQVHEASRHVAAATEQLAGSSHALAEVSERQSSAVSTSAAAVEQLTEAIASVAGTAQDVHAKAHESVERTVHGSRKVSHLVGEIGRIQQKMTEIAHEVTEFVHSTQAIMNMTREVRDIADQTNLLALNAAIEAARAGEVGRGFAVVADEVRKLAEKSGKSAGEIDSVMQAIASQSAAVQAAIRAGEQSLEESTKLAAEVEDVLDISRGAVEQSQHGVSDITDSVTEQKIAATEIAKSMERIATMVEENNTAAQNIRLSAGELHALSQHLSQAILGFRTA